MFLKFKMNRGAVVHVWKEDDSIVIAEYTPRYVGSDQTRCVWSRTLTPAQATELRAFLQSQGF